MQKKEFIFVLLQFFRLTLHFFDEALEHDLAKIFGRRCVEEGADDGDVVPFCGQPFHEGVADLIVTEGGEGKDAENSCALAETQREQKPGER